MSDPEGRRTLTDLVADRPERLFHVGRLDTDTSGLLILTNDGDFAQRLAHPSYEVDKTYVAEVDRRRLQGDRWPSCARGSPSTTGRSPSRPPGSCSAAPGEDDRRAGHPRGPQPHRPAAPRPRRPPRHPADPHPHRPGRPRPAQVGRPARPHPRRARRAAGHHAAVAGRIEAGWPTVPDVLVVRPACREPRSLGSSLHGGRPVRVGAVRHLVGGLRQRPGRARGASRTADDEPDPGAARWGSRWT